MVALSFMLMSPAQRILYRLKEQGFRLTKVRAAVLELFATDSRLFSAPDILSYLQTKRLRVNKTTVYRELEFLLKQRLLQTVQLGDGKVRYELASDVHHHHIVCLRCDHVAHIALENDLAKEEDKIRTETQFQISHHSLEFFGLCRNCQQ